MGKEVICFQSRNVCFSCVKEESKNADVESLHHYDDQGFDFLKEKEKAVYKRNNKLLLDENDISLNETEFKNLIRIEMHNYFNPFDNIVVLAGAGSSIVNDRDDNPDNNYGHTMAMLAKAVCGKLQEDENLYTVSEMSEFCHYSIPVVVEDNSEEKYNTDFLLEDFLSKVITYEEFLKEDIREKYIKTKNQILEIIKEKTSYSFDKEKHNHSSLIKILSNLIKTPSRLTIVTSNYDTLFEDAASYLNFTVFDGFSFDAYPKFDIDLFDWSLVKSISNVKSDKVEYKKSTMNLLKIHGSLTWKKDGDEIVRIGKKRNNEPIMIFPSSNKYSHSYEKPYFELFSKFQEILKKPNTLFITTGFSFADNHIAKMVMQAIKSTPSLSVLVTDHTINSAGKSENWREIKKLMEDGYRIAFLKTTLGSDLLDFFDEGSNDY